MVDEQPQLHDLTKFLLDRLKTYPEEFVDGRWEYEIGVIDMVDAGNNRKALNDALDNHRMDMVLKKTLEKLLTAEKPKTTLTAKEMLVQRLAPQLNAAFVDAYRDHASQSTEVRVADKITGAKTTLHISDEMVDDNRSLGDILKEALKP